MSGYMWSCFTVEFGQSPLMVCGYVCRDGFHVVQYFFGEDKGALLEMLNGKKKLSILVDDFEDYRNRIWGCIEELEKKYEEKEEKGEERV